MQPLTIVTAEAAILSRRRLSVRSIDYRLAPHDAYLEVAQYSPRHYNPSMR
jgi:hypothetical protein